VNAPTWIVSRNRAGFVLENAEIAPGTDLRAALTAAHDARVAAGWTADEIGPSCAFFFAARDGVRLMIAIERQPPRDPLTCDACG